MNVFSLDVSRAVPYHCSLITGWQCWSSQQLTDMWQTVLYSAIHQTKQILLLFLQTNRPFQVESWSFFKLTSFCVHIYHTSAQDELPTHTYPAEDVRSHNIVSFHLHNLLSLKQYHAAFVVKSAKQQHTKYLGLAIAYAFVTVPDYAGRPSRTLELSPASSIRYRFTKEVTSLARPVHTLPAQHHLATFCPAGRIGVRPRTPDTVSTTGVLTTPQLLYNIKSPCHEDSHSFFHQSLWTGNCHSHIWPLFHTCTDTAALWCSHFGCHCNSGWLCWQAESNPEPLACQARICYHFTKEVASLTRPIHRMPAQRHSTTHGKQVRSKQHTEWTWCLTW